MNTFETSANDSHPHPVAHTVSVSRLCLRKQCQIIGHMTFLRLHENSKQMDLPFGEWNVCVCKFSPVDLCCIARAATYRKKISPFYVVRKRSDTRHAVRRKTVDISSLFFVVSTFVCVMYLLFDYIFRPCL